VLSQNDYCCELRGRLCLAFFGVWVDVAAPCPLALPEFMVSPVVEPLVPIGRLLPVELPPEVDPMVSEVEPPMLPPPMVPPPDVPVPDWLPVELPEVPEPVEPDVD
jgi:hypothetical protein